MEPTPHTAEKGFPTATRAQWEACALDSLKGRPLASLRTETEDALAVEVMYWPDEVASLPQAAVVDPPAAEGERPGDWEIRQILLATDPEELAAEIREALARGQRRLPLALPAPAGEAAWLRVLGAVEWNGAGLDLLAGAQPARAAALLSSLPGTGHRILADWAGAGWTAGSHPTQAAAELADLWRRPEAPRALLRVGGWAAHAAGATSAQELALWLSAWTACTRELENQGMPLERIVEATEHELSCSRDLFESVARLRAARWLAARWLELAGRPVEERRIVLGARGSLRHHSRRDPWTNLLRVSLSGFAAAAAGADFLHLPSLAEGIGRPDAWSRRLAANAQVILREEAHLARVADPARGSAYVETLTARLAEEAWTRFQELERAGGHWAALAEGLPQAWLHEARERRLARLARRRETLVGLSAYPNLKEKAPSWLAPEAAGEAAGDLLAPSRLGEELERLRTRGEALLAGSAKPVWLACFGPLKQHKARADFSRGFLAVAGLPCAQDGGHEDPAQAARAARAAGAAVVVCCSTDDSYPALTAPFVQALRGLEAAAGAPPALLLLAGHPAGQVEELAAAGIQGFIHLKASLSETLSLVLQHMEVTA
jgi:methylmalonyl-CoA mutase